MSRAFPDAEGAETEDPYFLSIRQRLVYRLQHAVDRILSHGRVQSQPNSPPRSSMSNLYTHFLFDFLEG